MSNWISESVKAKAGPVGAGESGSVGSRGAKGEVDVSWTLWFFVAAGGLILLYLLFRNQSHDQPRQETQKRNVFGMVDFGVLEGGQGDHFLAPEDHHHNGYDVVTLPIRYPARSGINITTLINQGFTALRKSAPQDADWMNAPPSEVDL